MELFTDGIVKSGDRDFTRLVGGFGEDSPTITDKQVAELLGYRHGARHVRSQVNENIKHLKQKMMFMLKIFNVCQYVILFIMH